MLGNGQALLGMPDINVFNIININVNTVHKKYGRITGNCFTKKAIPQSQQYEQQYINMMQETDRAKRCYINTDIISNLTIHISQWLRVNYLIQ